MIKTIALNNWTAHGGECAKRELFLQSSHSGLKTGRDRRVSLISEVCFLSLLILGSGEDVFVKGATGCPTDLPQSGQIGLLGTDQEAVVTIGCPIETQQPQS
jgi:hypothetical protein